MIFKNLSQIEFAAQNAEEIKSEIISEYESVANAVLYPGDPVRLFLETIAYIIAYQRGLIDFTGKMNLLAYARGDYLDHLGSFMGVARLPAKSAVTTVRFKLSEVRAESVIIPQGTRVSTGVEPYFAVDITTEIPVGEAYADVKVTCLSAGVSGNGLLAGQINTQVDPIAYVESVANLTVTTGGSDAEDDENLRERIQLAPESFSVAGSSGAYEFWTRSAHQNISSVAVHSPTPGVVNIYPLLEGGEIPAAEIIEKIAAVLSGEKVRPLTDQVHVYAPQKAEYTITAKYWIDRVSVAAASSIQAAVSAAVAEWITWQRSKLGRDINPSELIHRMVAAGAKRVHVESPVFTVLEFNKVAILAAQTVTFGGLEDG